MDLGLGLGDGESWEQPELVSRGQPEPEMGEAFFLSFQHKCR